MKTPEQTLAPGVALHAFEDRETLAERLAAEVADNLRQAIRQRGQALLVVSGGRSPVTFLNNLAALDVAWQQVDIVPADERWVPATSARRNSWLIRQHLLQGAAGRARFHELIEAGAVTPEEAAAGAGERLAKLTWPADVVVLGMGGDGHTASLFPDAPELEQGLSSGAPVLAMRPPSQAEARLSLSAATLSGAAFTVLLLQGEDKREALLAALASPAAIRERPVRYFFAQPLQIFWSP